MFARQHFGPYEVISREPVREWLARRRHEEPPLWWTLVRYFKVLGYILPAADPQPGTVIGFNESGHAVVLASDAQCADTDAEARAAALDTPASSAVADAITNEAFERDVSERLTAEHAALKQLTEENPEVFGSKFLNTALD